MLFLKGYFSKGLHYRVNNTYSINKTLIKNNINTITVGSDIENKIYYLPLALLNSSPTKKCKLEVLLVPK